MTGKPITLDHIQEAFDRAIKQGAVPREHYFHFDKKVCPLCKASTITDGFVRLCERQPECDFKQVKP